MYTDEQIKFMNTSRKVYILRWYSLSYKPAVEKYLASGKISRYTADKLLVPYTHLERQRLPTKPRNLT